MGVLRSELLAANGFSHGFFTREGGVSDGVFSSLNFAAETGDSTEHVEQNLSLAAQALGIDATRIYYLTQVHGTGHEVVGPQADRLEFGSREGDTVLCHVHGHAAAIRTADCVPVLLACRDTGWVAACHSGWQGCVVGAATAAVRALKAQGAQNLIAAIGPHISLASFEVSGDVAAQLVAASPTPHIVDHSRTKPHIDLRKMVRAQLMQSGLAADSIDDVLGCTYAEPARFFSFRRDQDPSGRMLSAILPREHSPAS